MALSLVTIPDPIQQYPSGLIAIRAEDFVGPARGTLTTVADADSLAGTVVRESQGIALATTTVSFTTRYGLASDTIRIPWGTLTALFPANTFGAYFMASIKVAGDTPTGGDAFNSTHLRWKDGDMGPGMGWGRDTTLLSTNGVSVWRSVWGGQYMITAPSFISVSSMTGTNMVMRLWGITGGDLVFDVDALYIMPAISSLSLQIFPSDHPALDFSANGTMSVDEDSDATDVQIGGNHSTTWMTDNTIDNIFTTGDLQQANDEPTYFDINGNGIWDGSSDPPGADPQSWISVMLAPTYIPAQNLLSDPFNNTIGGTGTTNPVVSTPSKFTKTMFFGNFTPTIIGNGVSEQGGFLRARLGANQPAPTPITSSFIPNCAVFFGAGPVITGETNTPDHQHPLLTKLEDCVQTFSFDVSALGIYRIMCGQTDSSVLSGYRSHGAFLEMDGSGNLNLWLVSTESGFVPPLGGSGVDARIIIDGPVNITGSFAPTTTYWLKVERRRYHWRAKCWADGDTEPGWQVEGFQYLVATDSGGGNMDWVAHPYNTNWVGDANHDLVNRDPTDSRGCPIIVFEPDFMQPGVDIRVFQYDLEIDPDGIPVDMNIEEERYDSAIQWGSVTVPYSTIPSWQFAEGGLRRRHFSNDSRGYNLRLWKSPGGAVLQQSSAPILWERAKIGAFLPHIYRRTYG